MAWMRMMGADSVAYHRETVMGRADDHAGAAAAYYASRGETPLVWGGAGARGLGLAGPVTDADYGAVFGPGGAVDPATGERLVVTRRPGIELVVSAHKSVAVLGVVGRAEHMHQILDAETDATLAFLDAWTRERGGRRGREQERTPTEGVVWARTRHATSRAGDPNPHDHVLVANVVRMADERAGFKAADTAGLRDQLHAATMVGRVAAAAKAVELGYAIEADPGPSGRLGHWRIAGVPTEVCDAFSTRAAEITAAVSSRGYDSPQARQVAARQTRSIKRHTPPAELMAVWAAQLDAVGVTRAQLLADMAAQRRAVTPPEPWLRRDELGAGVAAALAPDSALAQRKVFARADVIVAVAPGLFGRDPGELDRVVHAVIASPESVPLLGVPGARDRAYAPACVISTEEAIAELAAEQAERVDAACVDQAVVRAAVRDKQRELGGRLTGSQRDAAVAVCTSGRGAEVVVGVAGAGKTSALDVVRAAFEAGGHRVLGTSTSGQAARTLGREAHVAESRTLASLLWRLDHDRLVLSNTDVVLLDEAGMAEDRDVLRVLTATAQAGAKLIVVGDHRQLGAVGPGGTFEGVVAREAVHVLDQNVRQRDRHERAALAQLRHGDLSKALRFYTRAGRIHSASDRDDAVDAMVDAWAADVADGADTTMLAWRRANVAELNRRARQRWATAGRLQGPELDVGGGRRYAAGDRVVTLAPGSEGRWVTSERGTVAAVDRSAGGLAVRMDDGRTVTMTGEEAAADRLDHAYAVTVHRSQGATVDTAHLLADGGGRELGYVGMSRARQRSYVYVVADTVDQAADDLRRDWSTERRQRWAIDTGTPTPDKTQERRPKARAADRRRVLEAERAELAAVIPINPTRELGRDIQRLQQLRQDLADLPTGRGRWANEPEGKAAQALQEASALRSQAESFARLTKLRMRHQWSKDAKKWSARERRAQAEWDRVGVPVEQRLTAEIATVDANIGRLVGQRDKHEQWLRQHPDAVKRIEQIDRALGRDIPDSSPSRTRAASRSWDAGMSIEL